MSMNDRTIEILLIEDNQADAELTRTAMGLRKMLFNLHLVKTGEDALHFLNRIEPFSNAVRPDLILLDLNLTGIGGHEVLERIKTDQDLRKIPVVVLTSVQSELDILKSYSMGASSYIIKPVDFDNFSHVVQKIQDYWCSVIQLPRYDLVEKYKVLSHSVAAPSLKKTGPVERVNLLYIEDSDADSEIIFQNLSNLSEPRFILHREICLLDSFKYLEDHAADVVLLDLSLPDSESFETVLKFRASHPTLPLVVLTGGRDKALGMRSITEGADDYLVKGEFESELLGRTLVYAIERKFYALGLENALVRECAARNDAEKAVGIRDEFLSIAGHELRTPLTALKLQIQMLIRTLQRGEKDLLVNTLVQNFAEKADGQIDHCCRLIDSLLTFSNIQSGRLKLEYVKLDLNQVVRNTAERFIAELEIAGCEMILDLTAPVEGEWDLLRLEQVLTNLISNGIKYAPGRPITVSVTSNQEKAWISVKDQGPGIAPQDREKIFQRFERVPTTAAVPGLGLGLYVVRQIIDTHGGFIQLDSELGSGSVFTVCLPRNPRVV